MENNQNGINDWGKVFTEILNNGVNPETLSELKIAIGDSVVDGISDAGKTVSDALRDAMLNSSTEAMKNSHRTVTGRKPYNNRAETEAYAQMLQKRRQEHNERVAYEERMRQAQKNVELAKRAGAKTDNVLTLNGKALPTKFEPIGKNAGTTCVIIGSALSIFSGASLLVKLVTLAFGATAATSLLFPGAMLILGGILVNAGVRKKNLLNRARRYAQICGEKMYGDVKALASSMGLKPGKVKKDIRKMLRMGFFPEGYLDAGETTLMLSEGVYKEYQKSVLSSMGTVVANTAKDLGATPKNETPEEESEAMKMLTPEQKKELKAMISDGNSYIARLHRLNDDIPGEHISLKLSKLENILTAIFTSVEAHPSQMGRMHKLMDYYLPTMIKLVETYSEYDKISNPGPDILSAKEQIEGTLDTINEAFIQLQNNLFQDSVWDVTSDAEVLTTMLKQEGLVSDI